MYIHHKLSIWQYYIHFSITYKVLLTLTLLVPNLYHLSLIIYRSNQNEYNNLYITLFFNHLNIIGLALRERNPTSYHITLLLLKLSIHTFEFEDSNAILKCGTQWFPIPTDKVISSFDLYLHQNLNPQKSKAIL